jgi:hypothetical protein
LTVAARSLTCSLVALYIRVCASSLPLFFCCSHVLRFIDPEKN